MRISFAPTPQNAKNRGKRFCILLRGRESRPVWKIMHSDSCYHESRTISFSVCLRLGDLACSLYGLAALAADCLGIFLIHPRVSLGLIFFKDLRVFTDIAKFAASHYCEEGPYY